MNTIVYATKCALAAVVLCAAQSVSAATPNNVDRDVQEYATQYRVTLYEAQRRLRIQHRISELNLHERLYGRYPEAYAGIYIQHPPRHGLVVQWVGSRPANMARVIGDERMASTSVLRSARYTFAALQKALDSSIQIIDDLNIKADIAVDIKDNIVKIYVTDETAVRTQLTVSNVALPVGAILVKVPALGELTVNIGGGYPLSTCTSGFSVRFGTYVGITTAGHCDPDPGTGVQYHGGTLLPYQSGSRTGSYDVQWHTTPGYTPVNHIFIGGGQYRTITSYKGRFAQVVGDWVCKFGQSTGYTCATILNNQYRPPADSVLINPAATYIQAGDPNEEHARAGDSGGPFFFGNIAFGTSSGAIRVNPYTVDAFYMPAEFIESYGLTIMTD